MKYDLFFFNVQVKDFDLRDFSNLLLAGLLWERRNVAPREEKKRCVPGDPGDSVPAGSKPLLSQKRQGHQGASDLQIYTWFVRLKVGGIRLNQNVKPDII